MTTRIVATPSDLCRTSRRTSRTRAPTPMDRPNRSRRGSTGPPPPSSIMRAYEGREAVLLELLETKALVKANADSNRDAGDLPVSLRNSPGLANKPSSVEEGGGGENAAAGNDGCGRKRRLHRHRDRKSSRRRQRPLRTDRLPTPAPDPPPTPRRRIPACPGTPTSTMRRRPAYHRP